MPSFIFSQKGREMALIYQALQFLIYYPALRVRVILGLHQTPNPLDLRWRWNYKKYRNERMRDTRN